MGVQGSLGKVTMEKRENWPAQNISNFLSALDINSFLGRIYPFQQLLTISPACPQSRVA